MAKVIIVYSSRHHGNTRKLVEAISEKYEIHTVDADAQQFYDLSEYELIGFASGIDFGKFYPAVVRFLERNLPHNKKVFFIYTCARDSQSFTESIAHAALEKNAEILGVFGSKGYNTYGPLKLIGGMNKGHPDDRELQEALQFYEELLIKTDLL